MKITISVPNEVFRKAERLARRGKKPSSQLYTEAIAEYVRRHDPDSITAQMNRVCEELDSEADPFLSSAARRILERTEW